MKECSSEALAKRQAQWDAFHQWEVTREILPLTLEERMDWYVSADQIARSLAPHTPSEDVQMRVKQIQLVRERLADLRVF